MNKFLLTSLCVGTMMVVSEVRGTDEEVSQKDKQLVSAYGAYQKFPNLKDIPDAMSVGLSNMAAIYYMQIKKGMIEQNVLDEVKKKYEEIERIKKGREEEARKLRERERREEQKRKEKGVSAIEAERYKVELGKWDLVSQYVDANKGNRIGFAPKFWPEICKFAKGKRFATNYKIKENKGTYSYEYKGNGQDLFSYYLLMVDGKGEPPEVQEALEWLSGGQKVAGSEPSNPSKGNTVQDLVAQFVKDMGAISETGVVKGSSVYNDDKDLVETRSFYSWHLLSLSSEKRVDWMNGLYQDLIKFLEDQGVDVGAVEKKICTTKNYKDFSRIVDRFLFELRNIPGTEPEKVIKEQANKWWNATFYHWLYSNDLKVRNAYPSSLKGTYKSANDAIVARMLQK